MSVADVICEFTFQETDAKAQIPSATAILTYGTVTCTDIIGVTSLFLT